jgi:hypothetical protein
LLFIVRTFFNDTVTVAVWTSFHLPPSCGHGAVHTAERFADFLILLAPRSCDRGDGRGRTAAQLRRKDIPP